MITLVVECSMVGNFNRSVTNYFKSHTADAGNISDSFSIASISNVFIFMAFFFKLLDGETKFLRLFSALGYSYASYVPAIGLTLVNIGTLKWLFIALALMNQLISLERQSAELLPKLHLKPQGTDDPS